MHALDQLIRQGHQVPSSVQEMRAHGSIFQLLFEGACTVAEAMQSDCTMG